MNNTVVLWACKVGEASWMEEVITETNNPAKLSAAKQWAINNGYDRLRIMAMDGKLPDFAKAINI